MSERIHQDNKEPSMAGLLDLPLARNAPGGIMSDISGRPSVGGILGGTGPGPVPAFAPPLHPLGQMMPHAGFLGGPQSSTRAAS
jgi:hypothetical protein